MAYLYADAERDFAKRRKKAEFKTLWRDVRMYQEADGSFRFTMFIDYHRKNEVPLATLTPDNVYMIVYKQGNPGSYGIFPTVCNRITNLLGLAICSNKQRYSRYESWVRIYDGTGAGNSIPYFPGIQFRVFASGSRWATANTLAKCLNPKPDRKLVRKNDAIQQAKAGTAKLRKLVSTCMKLGSFNELLDERLANFYMRTTAAERVEAVMNINLDDPQYADAYAVVVEGSYCASKPNMYKWQNGKYIPSPAEERAHEFGLACVKHGLARVRDLRFYDGASSLEQVEVPAEGVTNAVPAETA